MHTFHLEGEWLLTQKKGAQSEQIPGRLPGCNYLDLLRAGKLEDPYYGLNEHIASHIAEDDCIYSRSFHLDSAFWAHDKLDLVFSGLDTLAILCLNGTEIAATNNAHRSYRIPVKDILRKGENTLSILLRSPLAAAQEQTKRRKLGTMMVGRPGINHLRKPQCHFGWDWGPMLPPSGLTDGIALEAYNALRIDEVVTRQTHADGNVVLDIRVVLASDAQDAAIDCVLTAPDGTEYRTQAQTKAGKAHLQIPVSDPLLWWCNGLGEQPLYTLCVNAVNTDKESDAWEKQIGLRTIELETNPDEWGRNFRFKINGVPIFGKGANWIPSDCFVNRTSLQELEWYIRSARDANMNLLRIWGGGYYESDAFYALCDRYGILVWQDFAFACALYPFDEPEFLENVYNEVCDNVKRLRHHASLALWCGNNEIQQSKAIWAKDRQLGLFEINNSFFYQTLAMWVKALDSVTAYWPGSPASNRDSAKDAADLHHGDAHLWSVWHGMLPVEAYRKMPARFCSEFGMESLPGMRTIESIAPNVQALDLFSPVMLSHQKCGSGNAKMLYYLLAKYRNPATLSDFVYLSQLMQAETMRYATEFWRRNSGRCNGALYWQYNDCWPVASWAGIDYGRQFKALQYFAKRYNSMLLISADLYPERAEITVVNDLPAAFRGQVRWQLLGFDGTIHKEGSKQISVQNNSARKVLVLRYKDLIGKVRWKDSALALQLLDENSNRVSRQQCLLVPDKEALLQKPHIKASVQIDGETASLTLCSDRYARYVRAEIDAVEEPLSDNYFDLPAKEPYTVTFPVPAGCTQQSLLDGLRLHSLADVTYKGTALDDKRIRMRILLNPKTHMSWKLPKYEGNEALE